MERETRMGLFSIKRFSSWQYRQYEGNRERRGEGVLELNI